MSTYNNPFSGCGIAGILFSKKIELNDQTRSKFSQMLDSLKHRGPDGSGVFSSDNILLGHRRLSILDTSNSGSQPMTRDHLTVTYNGEIYNFQDIKNTLQNEGIIFTSGTDTEVILRSYQKWGTDALQKFNGMFAFAIWDDKQNQLFIARDRLGKKPFYYYLDNNRMVFSSEILPLIVSQYFEPEINYEAFDHQIFASSFLEIDPTRTLIKNVYSIPPGHFMLIKSNLQYKLQKYWDIPDQKFISETNKTYLANQLEELLYDSINLRMISDVPVSAFLSGGIDSSLISMYASANAHNPLTSITINYSDGGCDPFSNAKDSDLLFSKAVVKHLNKRINHKIIPVISENITLDHIDNIIDLASISDDDRLISVLKNYECVRDLGFKVVLNGQGADEIMCGYVEIEPFYKLMFDVQTPDKEIIQNMFPSRTIAKPHVLNENIKSISQKVYSEVFHFYNSLKGNPDEKTHRFLTKTQLSRILQFEDFLSMKCSVECRLPFLDYRIVEFAFGISFPNHYLAEPRTGKQLLRIIAGKYLPQSIATRPKQAFPASRSEEKYQQLFSLIQKHQSEILNSDLINRYFDGNKIKSNIQKISIHEMWLILSVWRWENTLKCAIEKNYRN